MQFTLICMDIFVVWQGNAMNLDTELVCCSDLKLAVQVAAVDGIKGWQLAVRIRLALG